MRTKLTPWLSLLLVVAVALPLASDGIGECLNVTTTLASGVNDPVNGDEAFFKLSNGAANVMLLVDNSGSMAWLPQCPYGDWDANNNVSKGVLGCQTPAISPPDDPAVKTSATPLVNGTCLPATDTANLLKTGGTWGKLNATNQLWMEAIVPQETYADPGRGIQYAADGLTVLQDDRPPWGGPQPSISTPTTWLNYKNKATDKDCTGDSCLFDPKAYYFANDWGVTSATRRAHDTDATFPGACKLLSGAGALVKDFNNNTVDLGAKCAQCMTDHGYFMFNVKYATGKSGANYSYTSSGTQIYFKGTFLNANPPKAVAARKIVKDVLWVNDLAPSKLDEVRMGLAWFAGDNKGGLPVTDPTDNTKKLGLVPTKTLSFPVTADNYKKGRLPIMKFVNANGGSFASTSTPLAHAALSVGQYFADTAVWSALKFGAAFNNSEFSTLKTADKCSVCWDCQRNSVVVVTDGSPNEAETSWPSAITSVGSTEYAAACGAAGANCIDREGLGGNRAAMFPRVAYWLRHTALHPAGGLASSPYVYTVGIHLPAGDPANILQAAATLGDGFFNNASDAKSLADFVFKAVEAAADTQSSFSAPSVSAFQTAQTSTSQAFVSRFLPSGSNTWEGHVFAGKIFDEFVNGCDATKTPTGQAKVECQPGIFVYPNFNGNADPATGLSICGEVFLVDQDCKAIQEGGSTGQFFQVDYTTDPKNGDLTATPARFAWDGGYLLNYTKLPDGTDNTWYRTAYEPAVVDANGDGKAGTGNWSARNLFTAVPGATGGWTRVNFLTANAATLKPFMSIEPTWCSRLLDDIGFTATSTPAKPALASDQATLCAKAIIYWVRGLDVFDQDGDGCGAPGMPTVIAPAPVAACKGQERNRENLADSSKPKTMFWKLGDTFHSAPVAVKPPADVDQCDLAYENQCVATIHSPGWLPNQTVQDTVTVGGKSLLAYDAYWTNNMERKKVVVVGANDGMLHAFDAGVPDKTLPKDVFGNWQFTDGTGEELWGFIPPDLLPKLWRLVKRNGTMDDHQYMVDGSTMVRDVWVDENGDGKKQSTEFHTVGLLTERSGGTQWTGLDLTDPVHPVMRWVFPRPGSDDAKYMGQSWSDFAPRPPPIGPVKIKTNDARGFQELWIAMINGGYDPAMGQGRAVFMVDAWTGEGVWRFTDDDFKKAFGYGATTSMFPVPGAVSLIDIGNPQTVTRDNDGYFDTATWGDLGGNLFVARFYEPGTRDATTKRVTNWFAARTFEESRRDLDDLQYATNRSEFSYMPANTYEGTTRTLRTYLGSGNRERLMQKASDLAPQCTPDNLFSCCQAGCQVSATTTDDYGACDFKNVFACDATGKLSRDATSSVAACSATTDAVCASGKSFSSKVEVRVGCPGATMPVSPTPPSASGSITVDANGVASAFTTVGRNSFVSTGALKAQPLSRFYGIWAYGKDKAKQFATAEEAKTFEKNRFTDVKLASKTCTGPVGATCSLVNTTPAQVTYSLATKAVTVACSPATAAPCQATVNDAGWFFEYGADERTGSGATLGVGCSAWNSLTPTGTVGGATDMCSGSVGQPVMNGFLSDFVTGIPSFACGFAEAGVVKRFLPRNTTAPPSTQMIRGAVNAKGAVDYAVLTLDPGAAPTSKSLGTRSEVLEPVYWLEVDQTLHNCRHGDAKNCK